MHLSLKLLWFYSLKYYPASQRLHLWGYAWLCCNTKLINRLRALCMSRAKEKKGNLSCFLCAWVSGMQVPPVLQNSRKEAECHSMRHEDMVSASGQATVPSSTWGREDNKCLQTLSWKHPLTAVLHTKSWKWSSGADFPGLSVFLATFKECW